MHHVLRARAALLSLFVLFVVIAIVPSCGGELAPENGEAHVSLELRSQKQNGKEVGLPWLEPAIARADAEALVSAFQWPRTTAVRETNSDGAPSLYYAAVYLKSREERRILDDVQIHHSFMPLFEHEQKKWNGKKGRMSQSTNGKGALVFAVIPGAIYNAIRHWALAGDPLFGAILLRDIPAEAKNAEGSLSYDYLVQARFKYRAMEPIRLPANVGTSQQKLVILTARLALKAVAEIAEEVPRLIARALGDRDRNGLIFGWGAAGTITLRLTLDVRDTDPSFGGAVGSGTDLPMRRTWGAAAGTAVMLPGVRVSIWSKGDGTVLGLPTLFEGTTNASSMAVIKMAKHRRVRQLCIATENDAAEITDLLTEIEVCDFEGSVDKNIDHLKYDTWADVKIQDGYFNLLAQATDSRAYLKEVAGYDAHQAVINVGWIADAMGKAGTGGPFVPCLGFPNVSADLLILPMLGLVSAIPVAGPPLATALALVTPLLAVDMFFPDSDAMLSRGVATHEYGHFAMCSMLYDASVAYISTSWTGAVIDRIASGAEPPATASQAYDIEAFADFFAGQVVSGTNYFDPGSYSAGGMNYCSGATSACLDANTSSETGFKGEVARVGRTLHDAFDGYRHDATWVSAPGNADAWTRPAGGFITYGGVHQGDAADEVVRLPGAAIRTFVGKLSGLNGTHFMRSLAETIRANGYSWCETCALFALHDGVAAAEASSVKYATCVSSSRIAAWIGAPPDTTNPTSCNFTACPYPLVQHGPDCVACAANQISVSGTTCQTCPPGTQVISNLCQTCTPGNTCVPACPERQHMVSGVCQDCPRREISVNGVCQECPVGLVRYNNTCVVTCPQELDETVIEDGVCVSRLL